MIVHGLVEKTVFNGQHGRAVDYRCIDEAIGDWRYEVALDGPEGKRILVKHSKLLREPERGDGGGREQEQGGGGKRRRVGRSSSTL